VKVSTLLGFAVVAFVSACSSGPAGSNPVTHHVDISLVKDYRSIGALAHDSTLVVEGSVTRKVSQTTLGGVPFNNWIVSITRVLKGTASAPTVDVRLVAADNTPILKVGSSYVLFLTPTPDRKALYIVGAGAGVYERTGRQLIRQDSAASRLPRTVSIATMIRDVR